MRKILKILMVPIVCIVLVQNVKAVTYYEKTQKENISKNMTYESIKQVTDKGLLDIFVLKVPLKDPYIKVKPTISTASFFLKEPLTNLLKSSGAIAGVNGDFFDMTGTHSNPVGSLIIDGTLISADIANNMQSPYYATFMLDKSSNPFIDYVKFDIITKFSNGYSIHIASYNEVSDMSFPIVVNNIAMANTAALDAKFPMLSKIVVSNGQVTDLIQGTTVEVPKDGFLILMNNEAAQVHFPNIAKDTKVDLSITANVDHNQLQLAIGGAGRILKDGNIVADNGFVPAGRLPRTAVGYTQDGSQLILMVIDGRTHSVGASHEEIGQALLRFGAYNAMHFDGGGSSAMGIKAPNEAQASLVNAPLGGERRILNALGVFNSSPKGQISQLMIKPRSTKVFNNTGLPIDIFGVDEYYNNIPIPADQIGVAFSESNGSYKDGMYYPSTTGTINITANYSGLTSSVKIDSLKLAALQPGVTSIKAATGSKTLLTFSGLSDKGERSYIYSGMNYEVNPPNLGHMEGESFVADQLGSGYIKCYIGDIVYYIDVTIGTQTKQLNALDGDSAVKFVSFPDEVKGAAAYTNSDIKEGSNALELKYQFGVSETTQAAYAAFNNPLVLTGDPTRLSLWVYGDNSNNWLRTKLIDADNKEILLDLAKEINWTGWKQVSTSIPSGTKYPLKLERIYVANLSSKVTQSGTLKFDDLQGDVSIKTNNVAMGQSTAFNDSWKVSLPEKGNGFDITIVGNILANEENTQLQGKILNNMQKNTSLAVFAGTSNNNDAITAKNIKWAQAYSFTKHENVAIVNLTAKNGGIVSTEASQWQRLLSDISQSGAEHVIINVDISPIRFAQAKEYELLQEALVDLNKNILVISTDASSNTLNVRDGIRYINLSSINQDPKILRVRINGNTINYEFQPVN